MPPSSRGPGIPFPPPLVYVAGWVIAWELNRRVEFLIDGSGPGTAQTAVGSAALAGGLGVMLIGLVTFVRARTSVMPNQAARQLVTWGPYRFSRNPMYVGLTVAYVGLATLVNQAWPLVLLPAVLWGVTAVIAREERYLRNAFGEAYGAYCRRTRRWI